MYAPGVGGLTRTRRVAGCLAAVLLAAAAGRPAVAAGQPPDAAGGLQLSIAGGRVTLIAAGAPLAEVLAEWSRVGRTRFVGADRLRGEPLTLHLVDVPEARALRLLLQAAQGYVAAPRRSPAPGASRYDRVTILAAGGGAAAAGPGPAGGARPPRPEREPVPGPAADTAAADLAAQLARLQGALEASAGGDAGRGGSNASPAGGAGRAPGAGAERPSVALDHLQHLLGAAEGQAGGDAAGRDPEPGDAAPTPVTTPFPGMVAEPGAERPPPRRRRRGGARGAVPDPFTVVPAPPR